MENQLRGQKVTLKTKGKAVLRAYEIWSSPIIGLSGKYITKRPKLPLLQQQSQAFWRYFRLKKVQNEPLPLHRICLCQMRWRQKVLTDGLRVPRRKALCQRCSRR